MLEMEDRCADDCGTQHIVCHDVKRCKSIASIFSTINNNIKIYGY